MQFLHTTMIDEFPEVFVFSYNIFPNFPLRYRVNFQIALFLGVAQQAQRPRRTNSRCRHRLDIHPTFHIWLLSSYHGNTMADESVATSEVLCNDLSYDDGVKIVAGHRITAQKISANISFTSQTRLRKTTVVLSGQMVLQTAVNILLQSRP